MIEEMLKLFLPFIVGAFFGLLLMIIGEWWDL